VWGAGVLCALATGCSSGGNGTGGSGGTGGDTGTGNTIALGALVPLTGACGSLGNGYLHGIQLAVKEVNAAGGVLGGKKLRLVQKDSKTDGPTSAQGVKTLVQTDGVLAIVGPLCSSECKGAVPEVKAQGVLTVVDGSAPELGTADDGGFMFQHFPSDAIQGEKIAKLALDRGWNTAAVLYDNGAYGTGLDTVFKTSYTTGGGTITAEVPYTGGGTGSYATEAASAKANNPKVILFFGYPTETAKLLIQLQAASYAGNYIGADATQNSDTYTQATGVDFTKWLGVTAGVHNYTPFTQFASRYKAEYGADPAIYDAGAYDSLIAIALAIEAAATGASRTTVRDAFTAATSGGEAVYATDLSNALQKAKSTDINYDGVSSSFEFGTDGFPTFAASSYVTWTFKSDGTWQTTGSI
jgi:branched-chain amino acid transport system substrate-binding protein